MLSGIILALKLIQYHLRVGLEMGLYYKSSQALIVKYYYSATLISGLAYGRLHNDKCIILY